MENSTRYSLRYKDKSNNELKAISENESNHTEAKIAAIAELEKRDGITDKLQKAKNKPGRLDTARHYYEI